jgi:hypothetical protein|tara:strand:- start:987 stop:1394 length:408 start_codon:yes stop_codon:yes gene_type:complete
LDKGQEEAMVWAVTQRDSFASVSAGATTAVTPIKTADGSIEAAALYGFQLSVNASAGPGHSATVKVYGELAATYLYHESEIDLSVDTQALVMLTSAGTRRTASVPIFDAPHFTIKDTGGGGSKDYTILFFTKLLE